MIKRATLINLGLKYEVMEHYSEGSPYCADCGSHNLRELELDHSNNNGYEDRRRYSWAKGGHEFYSYLRARGYPDDLGLVVRCKNCHLKRHKLEGSVKLTYTTTLTIEFVPVDPIPDAQPQPLWEVQP